MPEVKAIPRAYRTLQALRSFGYDLNSSVTDLADNSIAADASRIQIDLLIKDGRFSLMVVDDGVGMSKKELREAMFFGANRDYDEDDLGKFGFGMKTASLAHCEKLTVISRQSKNSRFNGTQWDVSLVKETDEWVFLELDRKETKDFVNRIGNKTTDSSTAIFWDDMYELDEEYDSKQTVKTAEQFYYRVISMLNTHLSLVFHRFMDGTLGKDKTLTITVNGIPLLPLDPFQRHLNDTIEIHFTKSEQFFKPIEVKEKVNKRIVIRGYVLPVQEKFPSKEEWYRAKGNLSWNDAQGYYLYRANRIIKFGGWFGTRGKDEHTKLARVSIDVPPEFDSAFRLTVNKSKVIFPESLLFHLKHQKVNEKIVREANAVYRKKKRLPKRISNKIRNSQESLNKLSSQLISEKDIKIILTGDTSIPDLADVQVKNPEGSFIANTHLEALRHHIHENLQIVSGHIENGDLWGIVCDASRQTYKVIINQNHPFYKYVYEDSKNNRLATEVADALFFTLGTSEIISKTDDNAYLFNEIRKNVSETLLKIITEKII